MPIPITDLRMGLAAMGCREFLIRRRKLLQRSLQGLLVRGQLRMGRFNRSSPVPLCMS